MQFRNIGKTGIRVSELGLGTWLNVGHRLDDTESATLVSMAYDRGINLFDTAENYGWGQAQSVLGKIIRRSNWSRDSYCVCSKVFYGGSRDELPTQRGLSRKHLVDSCNGALERLGVDYLDLYLCHAYDSAVSVGNVVWTMHTLVMQGKVLHWGTSKWTADQIRAARDFAVENHLVGPALEQPEYNLVTTEKVEGELIDLAEDGELGLISWSPLKQGILAGRYDRGVESGSRFSFSDYRTLKDHVPQARFANWIGVARSLESYSRELGVTRAQLAIAWCLKNRLISSVLLGCSSTRQLEECLCAVSVAARMTSEMWLEMHDLRDASGP